MSTSHKNAEQVLDQLRGVLPDTSLITDAAGLKPYETDGLTAIRELPWLVVLPTTEQQVVEVVNICRQHQVPIIAAAQALVCRVAPDLTNTAWC